MIIIIIVIIMIIIIIIIIIIISPIPIIIPIFIITNKRIHHFKTTLMCPRSAVQFCRALLGYLITAHYLYAFSLATSWGG